MTTNAMTSNGLAAAPASAAKPAAIRFYPVRDTVTLLRRNMKNQLRDKVAVFAIIGIPVLFLLLFVYVFGGALGSAVTTLGAASYVDYVLPGLIIMTAAAGLIGISAHTSADMTEGIVARFKTMAIFRSSILIARVLSYEIQTLASIAVVYGIALLMGLTPTASFVEWIVIIGFLAYVTFTLNLLGLAFGIAASGPSTASNGPFPLILLPLVGSGIVPTDTMPTAVRIFAEYQPFTPMIETLRGLQQGTGIGNSWLIALAWATVIGVLGFWWSAKAFKRERPS